MTFTSNTAVVEPVKAMMMGSFPIQSCTACADECFEDGIGGFIVEPEAPEIIAERIRRAVTDDNLVNKAAEINGRVAEQRMNRDVIRKIAINEFYEPARAAT